jgi:hypothetical protein
MEIEKFTSIALICFDATALLPSVLWIAGMTFGYGYWRGWPLDMVMAF